MNDEGVDRCMRDALADYERQGGLGPDDVHRLVAAHRLGPEEAAAVFTGLAARGVPVEEDPDASTVDGPAVGSAVDDLLREAGRYRLLNAEEEVRLGRRIRLGLEAERALGASPGDEQLRQLSLDGLEARRALVLANIRLVYSIAKRYQHHGLDMADLIQEGVTGLMRAAVKYDYELGYKFSTYATWWIRQSITRALADRGRLIRLPVHFVEQVNRVRSAARRLERSLDHPPTLAELSEAVGLDPAQIQFIREKSQEPISLDAPLPGADVDLQAFLGLPYVDVEETTLDELERQAVRDRLAALREMLARRRGTTFWGAEILERRFGLGDDGRVWTLEELGQCYGVTRERIRQVQEKLLQSKQVQKLFENLRTTEE